MKGNLVLCGFMGSGKTSIGKRLAARTGMEFIDIDDYIQKKHKKKISDIFRDEGEEAFRQMETQAARELAARTGCIIASGGGTVLRQENVDAFHRCGCIIVLLDTPLPALQERLKNDTQRPLLQVPNRREVIERLYNERMPLYRKAADVVFYAGYPAVYAAKKLAEALASGQINPQGGSCMTKEKLAALQLPDLLTHADETPVKTPDDWRRRRDELLRVMQEEEYGVMPDLPVSVNCREISSEDPQIPFSKHTFAGKAVHRRFEIQVKTESKEAAFPFDLIYPNTGTPCPVFVHISFDHLPHNYLPLEEVIDNGFAVAQVCYNDITLDQDEFESGIAPLFHTDEDTAPGKIALWAWALSRVMDQLVTLKEIDTKNAAVIGHSRLGKTALLCGAQDERFRFVIPNNSGCCGAALSRGKQGETVRFIKNNFPHWFCKRFWRYAGNTPIPGFRDDLKRFGGDGSDWYHENFEYNNRFESEMPFDQHFLTAAVAPRFLCVGGAVKDTWADPNSEYLCLCETSRVYELLGVKGLVHEDRFPIPGDTLHEGAIGLHLREHGHYLSRYDWNQYMAFIRRNLAD